MFNQKTFMYIALTFVVLALISKFTGGASSLNSLRALRAPAAPRPKKQNTFQQILSAASTVGKRFVGLDQQGQPIYAIADEGVI